MQQQEILDGTSVGGGNTQSTISTFERPLSARNWPSSNPSFQDISTGGSQSPSAGISTETSCPMTSKPLRSIKNPTITSLVNIGNSAQITTTDLQDFLV